jgi:dipicolinate synthase subunit B
MSLKGVRIGFGLTGSHCTISKVLPEMERLVQEGAEVFPIISSTVADTDTRFGKAKDLETELRSITGKESWGTLVEVEPIGPKNFLDLMIVAPCTGTTLAKLALGLSDSPVSLACKAHLRNDGPVVVGISTNDGLGVSLNHLASLVNRKLFYFVPFGQDNPEGKPHSLVAKMDLLLPTVTAALHASQIQPILIKYD